MFVYLGTSPAQTVTDGR